MKTVCSKHYYAHEISQYCPYCKPDRTSDYDHPKMLDCLDSMWGVLCNANEGDWPGLGDAIHDRLKDTRSKWFSLTDKAQNGTLSIQDLCNQASNMIDVMVQCANNQEHIASGWHEAAQRTMAEWNELVPD